MKAKPAELQPGGLVSPFFLVMPGTMVRGEFFVNIAGLNQKSWLLSALLT